MIAEHLVIVFILELLVIILYYWISNPCTRPETHPFCNIVYRLIVHGLCVSQSHRTLIKTE